MVRNMVDNGDQGQEKIRSPELTLSEHVEPGLVPGEHGAPLGTTELGGPVVETSGSRVGRANLGHTKTNEHDKEGDQEPTPDGNNGTTSHQTESKQGHDSDEHRRVGQGKAKVLETSELTPGKDEGVERGGLVALLCRVLPFL